MEYIGIEYVGIIIFGFFILIAYISTRHNAEVSYYRNKLTSIEGDFAYTFEITDHFGDIDTDSDKIGKTLLKKDGISIYAEVWKDPNMIGSNYPKQEYILPVFDKEERRSDEELRKLSQLSTDEEIEELKKKLYDWFLFHII